MNSNGHAARQLPSTPSDGKHYTAKELKALKTHREALEIQHQIKNLERSKTLTESLWRDWDQDDSAWLRLRGNNQDEQLRSVPPSQPSDRKHGKNWPIWDNELDLDILRQKSRILCDDNAFGRGYLRNMVNYVWYKGFSFKAQSKEDIDTDPDKPGMQEGDKIESAEKRLQDFIDRWCKYNHFNCAADPREGKSPVGTRGKEIIKRVYRDGESYTRFFLEQSGMSRIRPVEPELVRNGNGCSSEEGWSFGSQHTKDPETGIEDVEDILRYCIVYPGANVPQEIVEAEEIVHIKDPETDSTIKRGTTFFRGDVFDALYRASALQRNISIGAGVRAALAELWKTSFGTKDQITALSAGQRQYQSTDAESGKAYDVQRRRPGTRSIVPEGFEPVAMQTQAGTVSEPMQGVQGDLKQAGAAGAMPEFIISADASNANYSSTKEAGTPFVRNGETEQEHFKQAFLVIVWRAVLHAVKMGLLEKDVIELCDIQVEAAEITTTDKLEKAQVDQLLNAMRVKSQHTIAMEWGLDPEEQEANFQEWDEKHGGGGQGLEMPGEDDGMPPGMGGAGAPPSPPADDSLIMSRDSLGRKHRMHRPEAAPPLPESLQEAKDAAGHEHKGKGEGGGQFTGTGDGGEAEKPKAAHEMTGPYRGPFSVRKLDPGEILQTTKLDNGKSVVSKAPSSPSWAVSDADGRVVHALHPTTGKPHGHHVYPNKGAAERSLPFAEKQHGDAQVADKPKEPHEMSREEWFEQGQEHVAGNKVAADPFEGSVPRKARTDHLHRFHIQRAIAAGKPVPPEVLADYPDLKVKTDVPAEHEPSEDIAKLSRTKDGRKAITDALHDRIDALGYGYSDEISDKIASMDSALSALRRGNSGGAALSAEEYAEMHAKVSDFLGKIEQSQRPALVGKTTESLSLSESTWDEAKHKRDIAEEKPSEAPAEDSVVVIVPSESPVPPVVESKEDTAAEQPIVETEAEMRARFKSLLEGKNGI